MVSESEGGMSGLWIVSLLLFINVVAAFGAVKVQVAGVVWGCVVSVLDFRTLVMLGEVCGSSLAEVAVFDRLWQGVIFTNCSA